jgi:hypothetical protein
MNFKTARTSKMTAVKNDKRDVLCMLFHSLAGDVMDECAGDLTVLLTSGFPIEKPQHFPIGDLANDETTAANASFSGLSPSQIYVVTVNVVVSAGTSDWNQPTSQMVV